MNLATLTEIPIYRNIYPKYIGIDYFSLLPSVTLPDTKIGMKKAVSVKSIILQSETKRILPMWDLPVTGPDGSFSEPLNTVHEVRDPGHYRNGANRL